MYVRGLTAYRYYRAAADNKQRAVIPGLAGQKGQRQKGKTMLEWLKDILGEHYSQETEDKISAEIGKGFVSKADFDNKNKELKDARDTIKERDGQLEELKKTTGDAQALQQQIELLQQENQRKAEEYEAQLSAIRLDAAVEKALLAAHARNTTAGKALLAEFLQSAKVEEDGSVRGLDGEIKKLTEGQDTAFLFDGSKPDIGGASPAGKSGGPAPGKAATLSEAISKAIRTP